jgi:hypothetical protein
MEQSRWGTICHSVQKLLTLYITRILKITFTTYGHWSVSWATYIQFKLYHSISLRYILILSSHLWLCLLGGLFPSGFPTTVRISRISHACSMSCQFHLPWFAKPNDIWWSMPFIFNIATFFLFTRIQLGYLFPVCVQQNYWIPWQFITGLISPMALEV